MTHIPRKLTLLALCAALSASAQTPDAQVSFQVEIVQAAQGAADAIEVQRLTRYRDLGETDDIAVHLLDERTRIGPIVTAERGKGTLETLAVPALTARDTLAVDYLIGGRHRLPVVADEAALSKLPRNVRRPDPPEIIRELGIRLKLRPILLPDGQIRVRVEAIVNGIDFGNATLRSGYLVPAVTTRRANQLIDVKPGRRSCSRG